MKSVLFAALILAGLNAAHAEEHLAVQRARAFAPAELKIRVGDSVRFSNEDAFSHSVLSSSEAKSFDLGTLPKGTQRSVAFDKAGVVDVICGIHPNMKMRIVVAP